MTQDEIRAIALEVAGTDELTGDAIIDFATRFLAAIAEKVEPFGYWSRVSWGFNDNWVFMKQSPEAFNNRKSVVDSKVVESIPLYTHPAIEPAGEVVVTTTEEGRCVAVTRQDEEGRILKVIWEAHAIEPAPCQYAKDVAMPEYRCVGKCQYDAATLPDEVEQMVERLRMIGGSAEFAAADMIERLARRQQAPLPDEVREAVLLLNGHAMHVGGDDSFERLYGGDACWIANLIERLARQVPPDCVEKYNELLYAVERKWPNESRHETALRYIRKAEERANSGDATIATGEVK